MKFLKYSIIVFLLFASAFSQSPELRGTWIAWAGADYPTKTEIADWMDQLAEHNINVVYVDVWRYGYPYWRSELFYNLTGKWTDPALEQGRDLLQEMIAEGHRVGIEVEAWFEAGFVATQENNDDIFDIHPEWFAQKKNGSYDFYSNGGIRYHWLSHCNPEAQQFLMDLAAEVARNYDVDGIEFDRVRYPELDCGYDSVTVALYKSEHGGQEPPTNISDPGWIEWRSQKLTEFIADLSVTIRAVNPELTISNAPLFYGYEQFCQDWPPWINQGHLDLITPQLYFASNSLFQYRLNLELPKVNDPSLFYPGISTVANGVSTPPGDLIAMIQTCRNNNLNGHVIWYHNNLLSYLDTLKASVYQQKVDLPYRSAGWRKPAVIINETDSAVQKSTGWSSSSSVPGFENGFFYTSGSANEWIEYYADIQESGWYEVYAFIINSPQAAPQASYFVSHNDADSLVYVDQRVSGFARWYKLGDFYLQNGINKKIVKLTSENIGSKILFTDAIMVLNTNRVLGSATSLENKKKNPLFPAKIKLGQNYPNPFNPETDIRFDLPNSGTVRLDIFTIDGKLVETLVHDNLRTGSHHYKYNAAGQASGVYFYRLSANNMHFVKKMLLLR